MKFKRGQSVVVKSMPTYLQTIDVIDFTKHFEKYDRYFIKPLNRWINANEIELEHIFNSPLYQALS